MAWQEYRTSPSSNGSFCVFRTSSGRRTRSPASGEGRTGSSGSTRLSHCSFQYREQAFSQPPCADPSQRDSVRCTASVIRRMPVRLMLSHDLCATLWTVSLRPQKASISGMKGSSSSSPFSSSVARISSALRTSTSSPTFRPSTVGVTMSAVVIDRSSVVRTALTAANRRGHPHARTATPRHPHAGGPPPLNRGSPGAGRLVPQGRIRHSWQGSRQGTAEGMEFWVTIAGLVRRRRVIVPALLVAVALGAAMYVTTPVTYVSSTTMILTTTEYGGTESQDPAMPSDLVNPMLYFNDSLKTTSAILIEAMNTKEVATQLGALGPTTLCVDDGRTNPNLLGLNGPFLYIVGESTSPDRSRAGRAKRPRH